MRQFKSAKGKSLYLWVKDQKPGDKTGDGVNNSWRLVKQDAARSMGY